MQTKRFICFIPLVLMSFGLLISCNDQDLQKSKPTLITVYANFSLDTFGVKPLPVTVQRPNNSLLSYESFNRDPITNNVTKISFTLIGVFDVPPEIFPTSYIGITGTTSILNFSVNDSPVMTISNSNVKVEQLIPLVENNRWKEFWQLLQNSNLEVSNMNNIPVILSCNKNSGASSFTLENNQISRFNFFNKCFYS